MGIVLFGLTGGLATGKSTVAARWAARGLPVVDADRIAREVVAAGTDGFREVVAAFGARILGPDGSLDRARVADIVFADAAARRTLGAITHPRIARATAETARSLAAAGEPLCAYEATLLVENGLADAFRPLVVVRAGEDAQVARATRRDGCTADQARARIRAQMPIDEKAAAADHVVDNAGSLDDLVRRADEVLDAVCGATGVDPGRYPRPPSGR